MGKGDRVAVDEALHNSSLPPLGKGDRVAVDEALHNYSQTLMTYKYNPELTHNSQLLRKNMTKEESKLWFQFLKNLPITVHRQKMIDNYIVDFYCAKAKVVIELDGSQHYETEQEEKDRIRDTYLKNLGITVLRYSNRDINEKFKSICEDIYLHLGL